MPAFGHLSDVVTPVSAITATQGIAGVTNLDGAACDMDGYESVLIIVQFGDIAAGAVTSVKVQQDTASSFAAAADLLGSAQTVVDTADGKMVLIDIQRPTEQFIRVNVLRATFAATVSAVYLKYGPRARPVTHATASVLSRETFIAPAEGTA